MEYLICCAWPLSFVAMADLHTMAFNKKLQKFHKWIEQLKKTDNY